MILPAALGLWCLIVLTPFGTMLEHSLVTHILFEFPLLILSGIGIGIAAKKPLSGVVQVINQGGIFGVILLSVTLAFWMIPRWLDASINDDMIALYKYVSLPLLVGLPLTLSWQHLHTIAKGVVKIEFLTMLFRLGWIYLAAPERLCNNYLLNEQQHLGQIFILLGFALGISWLLQVFFSDYTRQVD